MKVLFRPTMYDPNRSTLNNLIISSKDSLLSVGTDEHGSKIVRNYHQNSFKYDDIQDFVDHISSFYREEFNAINIDAENSVFIRTTDRLHQENCQKVWSKIESKLTKVTFLTLIREFLNRARGENIHEHL